MTARLEVELAIKQLPEGEIRDLAKWLQDYLDEMWDRQIEADLASGKVRSPHRPSLLPSENSNGSQFLIW
jgi:hypothetical protein